MPAVTEQAKEEASGEVSMVSLPVYNRTGEEVGTYEIDPAELAPRISKQLLHDVVIMYQSNQRLGTAQSKGRSDVAGTTKKMYRQKGTGNARAGSRRSNIRRGGGHSFAKRPRDWYYRLPKRAVRLATRMALAARITDQEVKLIDDLSFGQPKTKEMAGIVKALKLDGKRLLVAVAGYDANVYKSIRNLHGVCVLPVAELNALEVLSPRAVLMTRAALDIFRKKPPTAQPAGAIEAGGDGVGEPDRKDEGQ
jgi:large subunit ribosomal protein L4